MLMSMVRRRWFSHYRVLKVMVRHAYGGGYELAIHMSMVMVSHAYVDGYGESCAGLWLYVSHYRMLRAMMNRAHVGGYG